MLTTLVLKNQFVIEILTVNISFRPPILLWGKVRLILILLERLKTDCKEIFIAIPLLEYNFAPFDKWMLLQFRKYLSFFSDPIAMVVDV